MEGVRKLILRGVGSDYDGGSCHSLTSYRTSLFTETRLLSLVELHEGCTIWNILTLKKDSLFI